MKIEITNCEESGDVAVSGTGGGMSILKPGERRAYDVSDANMLMVGIIMKADVPPPTSYDDAGDSQLGLNLSTVSVNDAGGSAEGVDPADGANPTEE